MSEPLEEALGVEDSTGMEVRGKRVAEVSWFVQRWEEADEGGIGGRAVERGWRPTAQTSTNWTCFWRRE
jgi:hypothetical protein